MTVPNVFDLPPSELTAFTAECATQAARLSERGLVCTPEQVARGVQIGSLLELAATTRSVASPNASPAAKVVKHLAENLAASTMLAQAVEALGVDDPKPEQIAGFVALLEGALAGTVAANKRPKFRR